MSDLRDRAQNIAIAAVQKLLATGETDYKFVDEILALAAPVGALYPEQLIAVSFDPTQDASLPPKRRWIYLDTALATLSAIQDRMRLEEAEWWGHLAPDCERQSETCIYCERLANLRATSKPGG